MTQTQICDDTIRMVRQNGMKAISAFHIESRERLRNLYIYCTENGISIPSDLSYDLAGYLYGDELIYEFEATDALVDNIDQAVRPLGLGCGYHPDPEWDGAIIIAPLEFWGTEAMEV